MMSRKKMDANASMKRIAQVSKGLSPPGNALRRDLRTILYINITNIVNLFKSWDLNEDGMIHPDEFRKALDQIGIEILNEDEFQVLWSMIDMDKNGSLSVRQHGQSAPLAAPEVGSHASSGCARQLWLDRSSHGSDRPVWRPATALQSRPFPRRRPSAHPGAGAADRDPDPDP